MIIGTALRGYLRSQVCVVCESRGVANDEHPAGHVFEVKFCANDIQEADDADRRDQKFMAEHANLLGTGLGGAGAALVAIQAATLALDALSKGDISEVRSH